MPCHPVGLSVLGVQAGQLVVQGGRSEGGEEEPHGYSVPRVSGGAHAAPLLPHHFLRTAERKQSTVPKLGCCFQTSFPGSEDSGWLQGKARSQLLAPSAVRGGWVWIWHCSADAVCAPGARRYQTFEPTPSEYIKKMRKGDLKQEVQFSLRTRTRRVWIRNTVTG